MDQGQKLPNNISNNMAVLKAEEEAATQKVPLNLQEQSQLDVTKLQIKNTVDNSNYLSEENVEKTDSKNAIVEQKSVSFEDLLRELDKGKDGSNLSRLFEKVWKKHLNK